MSSIARMGRRRWKKSTSLLKTVTKGQHLRAYREYLAAQRCLRTQYDLVCEKIEGYKREIEVMKQHDWILENAAHRWASDETEVAIDETEVASTPQDKKEAAMAHFESEQAALVQQADDLWRQMKRRF